MDDQFTRHRFKVGEQCILIFSTQPYFWHMFINKWLAVACTVLWFPCPTRPPRINDSQWAVWDKGKLPSPVIRGSVVLGFGKQPHPIVKTTTIQSNGVRIRTSNDVKARTIFNGEVYSIIKSKNNTHTILIQHGNFFTVYKNLSDIYVKKGDKLKTKDSIGKIATDPLNGQTILSFSIFNNGVPQNPRFWIYKM